MKTFQWFFPRIVRVADSPDSTYGYKWKLVRGKVQQRIIHVADFWPWIFGPLAIMFIFTGWPTHEVTVYDII